MTPALGYPRPVPKRFPGAIVLALLLSVLVPGVPAHAATDVVRNLDVTYAVRADGTIDVTYELDWDFGTDGRRGIEFGILTREPWELDASKEARYDVADLRVTSPTGAPVDVQRSTRDLGSGREELQLRIGDEDRPLTTARETYVITYVLSGGLRTFDGVPQLFLDITGPDYPKVERFTITVSATGDIERARCLVGPEECKVALSGGDAVLSGRDVPRGTTISAVAELPAGQRGAQPNLRDRETGATFPLAENSMVTVDADGVAHVEHTSLHHVGDDYPVVGFRIPARHKAGFLSDHVLETTEPIVTDASGRALETVLATAPSGMPSDETLRYEVTLPEDLRGRVELVARWSVEGAVDSDGETATLLWRPSPLLQMSSIPTTGRLAWELPAAAGSATCAFDGPNPDTGCRLPEFVLDGSTVALDWLGEPHPRMNSSTISIEFPAAAVGGVESPKGFSGDIKLVLRWVATALSIPLAFLAVFWAMSLLGRATIGHRDLRYADAPPGEIGHEVTSAPFPGTLPVRFEPPSVTPAIAGYVLDRKFHPRHVAATLTNMAVDRAVQLSSNPLAIIRRDGTRAESDLEAAMFASIPEGGGTTLRRHDLKRLNQVVAADFAKKSALEDLFRPRKANLPTTLFRVAFWLALVAVAVWAAIRLAPAGPFVAAFVMFLFGLGFLHGMGRTKRRLGPRGSAIRAQAEGFRTYIRTAEAGRLSFEADRDVYREFLPWAVLYGETDRWTAVCRELAAAGHIPAPDPTFMAGARTPDAAAAGIASLSTGLARSVPSAFTSGSGGRSGFSGGASGGGGGGGTSAGSW